jgi:hypothetical protein
MYTQKKWTEFKWLPRVGVEIELCLKLEPRLYTLHVHVTVQTKSPVNVWSGSWTFWPDPDLCPLNDPFAKRFRLR